MMLKELENAETNVDKNQKCKDVGRNGQIETQIYNTLHENRSDRKSQAQ